MRLLIYIMQAMCVSAMAFLLANCGPAFQSKTGDILVVSDSTELRAALNSAQSGDTIMLEPNEYGDLDIKGSEFEEEVSIVASEEHSSNFESIHVEDSSNIKFENIRVGSGEEDSEEPIEIKNSENIEGRSREMLMQRAPLRNVSKFLRIALFIFRALAAISSQIGLELDERKDLKVHQVQNMLGN